MSLLDQTLSTIVPQDAAAKAAAHARLEALAMPYWALGRLLDMAEELAGMTGSTQASRSLGRPWWSWPATTAWSPTVSAPTRKK